MSVKAETTMANSENEKTKIPSNDDASKKNTNNNEPVSKATPTGTSSPVTIPQGWTELMGKDLVMKELSSSAASNTEVQHQDLILVDIIGRQVDSPSDETNDAPIFHDVKDVWIILGDKDVLPVVEMGIRYCPVGETVTVWGHSKFAYGFSKRTHEKYELPPNSNVQYDITVKKLISGQERDAHKLKWCVTATESKKNIANDAYQNEWSDGQGKARIRYLYEKAAKELELVIDGVQKEPEDEAEKEYFEKAKAILMDCLNNIAAVEIRAKEYHLAKEAAVRVLQREPNNFKGLIRAAKAALLDPASSYEEVDAALAAAAEKANDVQAKDLEKLMSDFVRRKQAYEQRSKKMYAKAFGGDKSKTKPTSSEVVDETKEDSEEAAELTEATSSDPAPETTEPIMIPEKEPFSWSKPRTWPWWSIGAYAFQLSMPFVMYYCVMYMRRTPLPEDWSPPILDLLRQIENAKKGAPPVNDGMSEEF